MRAPNCNSCRWILFALYLGLSLPVSAAEVIDSTRPLSVGGVRLEIDSDSDSVPTAVNEFVTVNWSVGSSYAASSIYGEVRAAGPRCAVAGVRSWPQVTGISQGAARLSIDADLKGCLADYCVIAKTPSGGREESCRRLDLQAPRGWIQLRPNLKEVAVGQEVALYWESDRIKNLSGSVEFAGPSCRFQGSKQSWQQLFGGVPEASGIQFREGPEGFAGCEVKYCLNGSSSVDGSQVSSCRTVQYYPAAHRLENWVRDGRYVYEPDLGKTSHITWAIRTGADWIGTVTEVAVGTAPGRADIVAWTPTQSESGVRFITPPGKFTYGPLYYASVRMRDVLGHKLEFSANGWRYLRDDDWPRTSPYSKDVPVWKNSSLLEVAEDDTVGLRTSEDVERARGVLARQLWPREGRLPTGLPQEVIEEPNVYKALAPWIGQSAEPHQADASELPRLLEGIADATGSLHRLVIRLPSGLESHAFWFRPRKGAVSRLAVVQQGHDDIAGTYGGGRSILFFLRNGFDVVSFFMPASGPNQASFRQLMNKYSAIYPLPSNVRPYHNDLFELARRLPADALGEHPVAVYLSPIRIALNYLTRYLDYKDISMIGCSGGGWTTTLYAALDPQIKYSFPVAGSLPLPLRRYRPVDFSDSEQHAAEIYSIAGYRDLYVMGSSGNGRRQVQVLNGKDDCCFRPTSPPASEDMTYVMPYVNIYEKYAPQVQKAASDFGGMFDVRVDPDAIHTISNSTLWSVVAPVLGIEPKMVLTMNGVEGGRAGEPRTPVQGDADLRYEWSCENCTGAMRGGYAIGGCVPTSSNNMIDWIKGPKGFQDVPGSASRLGCWIDFTLATEGSPLRPTTRYDWVANSSNRSPRSSMISFKMNGQEGSRDSSMRTLIRGDLDLAYDWNCQNCEKPPSARYSFGGKCGASGRDLPVDWINTIRGHQFVVGSPGRVGCWIDFTLKNPTTATEETFYFEWVPGQ